MSETLPDGPRRFLPYFVWLVTRVPAVFSGGFFLVGLMSGRLETALGLAVVALGLTLPASVLTCFILYGTIGFRLPRTVTLDNGILTIDGPRENESIEIARCRWSQGDSWKDQACNFLPRTECLLLELPSGEQIACGLTPKTRAQWLVIFEHFGLSSTPRKPILRWLLLAPLYGLVGAVVAGWITRLLLAQHEVVVSCTLIGFVDGLIVLVMFRVWPFLPPGWFRENMRSYLPAILAAALAFLLASGLAWSLRGLLSGINALVIWPLACVALYWRREEPRDRPGNGSLPKEDDQS